MAMKKENFLSQTQSYADGLADFIAKHELPTEWFKVTDHVAVKGRNASGFEELIALFRPLAERISCVNMDNRRLATAKLKEPLAVGEFGTVEWVEVMEPRPEKIGKDVVGFEHMEFYFPDFDAIRAVLDEKNISYEIEQNPGHQWVNIVINKSDQELKLNNRTLTKIVAKELGSGKAYIL